MEDKGGNFVHLVASSTAAPAHRLPCPHALQIEHPAPKRSYGPRQLNMLLVNRRSTQSRPNRWRKCLYLCGEVDGGAGVDREEERTSSAGADREEARGSSAARGRVRRGGRRRRG
jgi:hypothetical protein